MKNKSNSNAIRLFDYSIIRLFDYSIISPKRIRHSIIRLFDYSIISPSHSGFTIIELLVASLLLGMLVTILTMVFSQSSIAWRLGAASVSKVGDICDNVAELRDEADNAFIWNNQVCRMIGLWSQDGVLRKRACVPETSGEFAANGEKNPEKLRANILISKGLNDSSKPRDFRPVNVGQTKNGGAAKTYFVNVMSAGPDGVFDTYDDIWSFPDDFE